MITNLDAIFRNARKMEVLRKCSAIPQQVTVGVLIHRDGKYEELKSEEFRTARKVKITGIRRFF